MWFVLSPFGGPPAACSHLPLLQSSFHIPLSSLFTVLVKTRRDPARVFVMRYQRKGLLHNIFIWLFVVFFFVRFKLQVPAYRQSRQYGYDLVGVTSTRFNDIQAGPLVIE